MARSPSVVKPLILAGALCALGGFAYWLEFAKKPSDLAREADVRKIFALKNAAVTEIELAGNSEKPENAARPPLGVVLKCASLGEKLCHPEDASKWDLVAPLRAKADDSVVNGLLKNFDGLSSTDSIDLAAEIPEKRAALLKDYGLDQAARLSPRTRRVTLVTQDGKRRTAYFGAKHPIGDGVFGLLEIDRKPDENRVLVVPEGQLSIFDQKTSYLRDKTLLALNEKDVSTFTLTNSKKIAGKLEAKRTPDARGWQLTTVGKSLAGDPDAIDGMLAGALQLNAKDIVSDRKDSAEALRALSGAGLVYDLRVTAKGAEKHLRLYERKSEKGRASSVYAVVDGQDPLYEVDGFALDRLTKSLDELRVGKLISVEERYGITSIDVERRGTGAFRQTYGKDVGGKWTVGEIEAPRGKVEALLDHLTSKSVVAYQGPAPTEDRLRLVFRKMTDGKDVTVADLEFWTLKDRVYAKNLRAPKPEIMELKPETRADLPWTKESKK